jgi:hypothetical protein
MNYLYTRQMIKTHSSLKTPALVAVASVGILLVGAIVFFRERLFADTSYILFNIINFRRMSIHNHRYGSFITQIVPYVGQKFHLPVKALVIGYSISFNAFFLLTGLLLTFVFRHYKLAILYSLYYFLIVSDSYFLANDELLQGIGWLFLMFAVLLTVDGRKSVRVSTFLFFCPLAFLAITSHFIVMIPLVFLWVYLVAEKGSWQFSKKDTIVLSSLLVLLILIKFLVTQSESYDSKHLHGVTHFSLQDIIDSFTKPEVIAFFYRCLVNYWWTIIILALGIISLAKRKEKFLAWWTVISCLGYIILMGLTYADADSDILLCHIELEWGCIGIIAATPFVFCFLPSLKPSVAVILLVAIFCTRLVYIGSAIPAFTWRTHFQDQVIAQMKKKGIKKLVLYSDASYKPKNMLHWALPYESLLASAMNGDNPQLTFCFVDREDKQMIETLQHRNEFYNSFGTTTLDAFNSSYFRLDSNSGYLFYDCNDFLK